MPEPTERQVLYALVAGGFLAVVAVLIVFAAVSGLSPVWWSITVATLWLLVSGYAAINWKRTGRVLMLSIVAFVVWTVGTLLTR